MSRRNEIDWSELGADVSEADIVLNPGSATASVPGASPWADTFRQVLPVLATTYQQQQLNKLNTDRIRMGLPPLDAQTYTSQYMVPSARVQVGPTESAQKLIMYGGGALLAILAFRALKRH